jgi:hypothetical protein
MSIEGKHSYRFGYLKSEQWQNVRLEALVREKGKCQICGEESISNDAHHIWYPERIYETRPENLVVLCRPCHDFIHSMIPDCKTKDEDAGRQMWLKFSNAIIAWRRDKLSIFGTTDGIKIVNPKHLCEELARLKTQVSAVACNGKPVSKERIGVLFSDIRRIINQHLDSARNVILSVEDSDFEI